MKTVKVMNTVIGDGIPKIVVPMVGKTSQELIEEAKIVANCGADIIEWRVDFFEEVKQIDAVISVGKKIRQLLSNIPILFTFRTKEEGGETELSTEDYVELNQVIISEALFELNDIELFIGDKHVAQLVSCANDKQVKVVMCNHDFDQTPSKQEIVHRLKKMQELGADICKIAVMPNNTTDVLTLLDATNEMQISFANRPIVTMSMGQLGMISRVSGETFGSALTFGSAQTASAPGQVPVSELRNILTTLHNKE